MPACIARKESAIPRLQPPLHYLQCSRAQIAFGLALGSQSFLAVGTRFDHDRTAALCEFQCVTQRVHYYLLCLCGINHDVGKPWWQIRSDLHIPLPELNIHLAQHGLDQPIDWDRRLIEGDRPCLILREILIFDKNSLWNGLNI